MRLCGPYPYEPTGGVQAAMVVGSLAVARMFKVARLGLLIFRKLPRTGRRLKGAPSS